MSSSSEGLIQRSSWTKSGPSEINGSSKAAYDGSAAHCCPPPMEPKNIKSLAIAAAFPLILGTIDAIFNHPNEDFNKELRKPLWNPPGWLVFGLAWSLLYPAMGLASWLVWKKGGFQAQRKALGLYVIQLIVNLLWPYFFFGLHYMKLALLDIIALDFLIILCIIYFNQAKATLASNIFKAYLACAGIATLLNYTLLIMN